MSADVAAPVLPDGKEDGKDEEVRSPFDPNLPEDPRHSEWIKQSGHATRVAYNYAAYNMTEAERRAAEGEGPILAPGDVLQDEGWANNATVYEWCDEFGDVGPAHPVLVSSSSDLMSTLLLASISLGMFLAPPFPFSSNLLQCYLHQCCPRGHHSHQACSQL